MKIDQPPTAVGIDKDMGTEVDLVAGRLDVMPQIQIRREDGKVAGEWSLVLGENAFPVRAGGAAATAAIPTSTSRRGRIL